MNQPARIQLLHDDEDFAVVRDFSHRMKIACDDLHDDPFDPNARAHLQAMLVEHGPIADAALQRLLEPTGPAAESHRARRLPPAR